MNYSAMKLIVMRGLPGAGKSTWVSNNAPGSFVCSADAFLYDKNGVYTWTPQRASMAHDLCWQEFEGALLARKELIVVDNCNLDSRYIRPYVKLAEERGYEIEIRTLMTPAEVAQARGLHGVAPEKYPFLVKRLNNPLAEDLRRYEIKER
jgi:predicted kinase